MITATDFAFVTAPKKRVSEGWWTKDNLHNRVLEWCLERQEDITTRAVLDAFAGAQAGTVSSILRKLEKRGALKKTGSGFHKHGGRYWVWELAE